MNDIIRKYWRRLRQEKFSLRFLISRILLHSNINLPVPLMFCQKHSVRAYLGASSAAHKLFTGKYKPMLDIAVFENYISKGATVIDVGANIGMFTILASRLVGKNGRVFAFEPTRTSYKYLLENIDLNSVQNVFPFNFAIAKKEGIVSFVDHEYSKEQNRLSARNESGEKVRAARLDVLLHTFNITQVDFLKIDVEGAELQVLQSLGTLITDIKVIYLEFNDRNYEIFGYSKREIISFLHEYNFSLLVPKLENGTLTTSLLDDLTIERDTNCNVLALQHAK